MDNCDVTASDFYLFINCLVVVHRSVAAVIFTHIVDSLIVLRVSCSNSCGLFHTVDLVGCSVHFVSINDNICNFVVLILRIRVFIRKITDVIDKDSDHHTDCDITNIDCYR